VDEDQTMVDEDQTMVDEDQTMVDEDKTMVDEDQTMVDENQTMVDEDQTMVEEDQTMVDEDQTMVDEDQTMVDEDQTIVDCFLSALVPTALQDLHRRRVPIVYCGLPSTLHIAFALPRGTLLTHLRCRGSSCRASTAHRSATLGPTCTSVGRSSV